MSSDEYATTCPICMEDFDEFMRKPKLLPCSHTFCLICLQSLVKTRTLECPFCRESFPMGKYGPESLLNNSEVLTSLNDKYLKGLSLSVKKIGIADTQENFEESREIWCMSCQSPLSPTCARKKHALKNVADVMDVWKIRLGNTLCQCQEMWAKILRSKHESKSVLLAAKQATQQVLDEIDINLSILEVDIGTAQSKLTATESLDVESYEVTQLRDTLAYYENENLIGKEEVQEAKQKAAHLQQMEGYTTKTVLIAPNGVSKELPQWALALNADHPSRKSNLLSVLTYTLIALTEGSSEAASEQWQQAKRSWAVSGSNGNEAPSVPTNSETPMWVGVRPKTAAPKRDDAKPKPTPSHQSVVRNSAPVSVAAKPAALIRAPQLRRLACAFLLAQNGNPQGRIVFDLRPDVAPTMCQKVAAMVMSKGGQGGGPVTYKGANVFPYGLHNAVICVWRDILQSERFLADTSNLRAVRGSVRLRTKGNVESPGPQKLVNMLVDCEWQVVLESPDPRQKVPRFSTVFAHVTEGLELLDAIKCMDIVTVTIEECYMI